MSDNSMTHELYSEYVPMLNYWMVFMGTADDRKVMRRYWTLSEAENFIKNYSQAIDVEAL